jgi:SOS-response transcriptional repressor LexA
VTQPISPVQSMVLGFMREFFAENDQLPPARAICARFNWDSSNNASHYQRQLLKKGYLEVNSVGKYRFKREGGTA